MRMLFVLFTRRFQMVKACKADVHQPPTLAFANGIHFEDSETRDFAKSLTLIAGPTLKKPTPPQSKSDQSFENPNRTSLCSQGKNSVYPFESTNTEAHDNPRRENQYHANSSRNSRTSLIEVYQDGNSIEDENSTKMAEINYQDGANVDERNESNNTIPLHVACFKGDIESVKSLIEKDANVNEKNETNGNTPLHVACFQDDIESIKLLIENGADVTAKNNANENIFHMLCMTQDTAALSYLLTLSECTDLMEQKNFSGNRPLYVACAHDNVEAAKLLIKNGANVKAQGENRRNILQTPCLLGHITTVCYLLSLPEKANFVKHKSVFRYTVLHFACSGGHAEIAELLLKNGADIEAKTKYDLTPLNIACDSNHADVVRFLIKNNANIETLDKDCRNIFHIACEKGNTDIIRYLLTLPESFALMQQNAYYIGTPLAIACNGNHLDIVNLFVGKDANIEAPRKRSKIPNMTTFMQLMPACIQEKKTGHRFPLNERKILMEQRNKGGFTPLQIACYNGHLDIIKLLVENGADVKTQNDTDKNILFSTCMQKNIEITTYLLTLPQASSLMKHKDTFSFTPLCIACFKGHLEIVELLLDKGADFSVLGRLGNIFHISIEGYKHDNNEHLNVIRHLLSIPQAAYLIEGIDSYRLTPLALACNKGHPEIVELFIEHGANITAVSKGGKNIFHRTSQTEHSDVMHYLLTGSTPALVKQRSFLMEQKETKGLTPLGLACAENHPEMIELLIKYGANVTAMNKKHKNIFHTLSKNGCSDSIQQLLASSDLAIVEQKSALLAQKTPKGLTPLDIARNRGHAEIIEKLSQHETNKPAKKSGGNNLSAYSSASL